MPKGVYTRPTVPTSLNEDGSASIPLYARDGSVRAYAIVDAADAEWACQWRWNLGHGYAKRASSRVDGPKTTILMHRELLGLGKGRIPTVDHIDRNTLNNRRSNIRTVTPQENSQNQSSFKNTSSRYRGVCWNAASKKWQAEVKAQGKKVYLGLFASEGEAAEVARNARLRLMTGAVD